jgi:hypothetical protein
MPLAAFTAKTSPLPTDAAEPSDHKKELVPPTVACDHKATEFSQPTVLLSHTTTEYFQLA